MWPERPGPGPPPWVEPAFAWGLQELLVAWGRRGKRGRRPLSLSPGPHPTPTPALSPPRSFSSMSDITGETPGGPVGRAQPGGGCLAPLRPLLPALLLVCVPLLRRCHALARQKALPRGPWWGWGRLLYPSSALVLARLCRAPPQFWSTLPPLRGNWTVILAGPGRPLAQEVQSVLGPQAGQGRQPPGPESPLVPPLFLSPAPLTPPLLLRQRNAEALVPRPLLVLVLRQRVAFGQAGRPPHQARLWPGLFQQVPKLCGGRQGGCGDGARREGAASLASPFCGCQDSKGFRHRLILGSTPSPLSVVRVTGCFTALRLTLLIG